MKIDFTRIKDKYVVFSSYTDMHPIVFGPVKTAEIAGNTLILTTNETDYCAYADIDKEDNCEEILFITRYLWRAILFREYTNLR